MCCPGILWWSKDESGLGFLPLGCLPFFFFFSLELLVNQNNSGGVSGLGSPEAAEGDDSAESLMKNRQSDTNNSGYIINSQKYIL